jgi:ribosomal protein S18 acetylase RimI-like enzyme
MTDQDTIPIRSAVPEDAAALARLIDIAGEGIPAWLWSSGARPGEPALAVGEARARRETGAFSYRHALVAGPDGGVVAMLLGYVVPAPSEAERATLPDLPPEIRPMVELEQAPASIGTFYVNALAVLPGRRGRGLGRRLLVEAEHRAQELGASAMTIQVFSQNQDAARLYARHGYQSVARRPVLSHPCQPYYDEDILLLRKDLV